MPITRFRGSLSYALAVCRLIKTTLPQSIAEAALRSNTGRRNWIGRIGVTRAQSGRQRFGDEDASLRDRQRSRQGLIEGLDPISWMRYPNLAITITSNRILATD